MKTDCIFCNSPQQRLVAALGDQPLANAYLRADQLDKPEPRYPLDLFVCEECLLAHIGVVATGKDIFTEYAYFSSFSTTWLEHARQYVAMITDRLGLDGRASVLEIASNDGYLLQYFQQRGISCLGIEPARNIAEAARAKGIETLVAFWGARTADTLLAERGPADLILGNNVLAHTPDPNDLVEGIKRFLKPGGTVTMEFPHLHRLVSENQFDTIYHEHFSYFSFHVVLKIFAAHGLTLFDVEELSTHGGSLRIYAKHDDDPRPIADSVPDLRERERAAGMTGLDYYADFGAKIERVKRQTLDFLASAKREGKRVAGYGAPAKGNTLLNYCGATPDDIRYTVDRNPHKQGLHLPGTHIPIRAPEYVAEDRPDYLFILPWNLKDEIMDQMAHIRDWGGRFVVPIPELRVLP
ncbi:MAG TPA: class I SAM-dependent methyltransferase [Candidatus Hydrogenedentes bacterium]|nr:class I SAM-dependent methyltransferase [Candidatus Hydrogenedentota bacterium]